MNISDESNTLIVRRNADDVVNIGIGWTQLANETIDTRPFLVYSQGQARLKVQANPQASITARQVFYNNASGFGTSEAGGSDRVKLVFVDQAIENSWLRITVLADANTGLASNDVFYFGNARFDVTPNTVFPSQVSINVLDTNIIRARNGTDANNISNIFDVDKSGAVNVLDTNATRSANGINSLRPFTAPSLPASLLVARSIDSAFGDMSWLDDLQTRTNRSRTIVRRL